MLGYGFLLYVLCFRASLPLEMLVLLIHFILQQAQIDRRRISALRGRFQLSRDGRCVWRRQVCQVNRLCVVTSFGVLIELKNERKTWRFPLMFDAMTPASFRHLNRVCLHLDLHQKTDF